MKQYLDLTAWVLLFALLPFTVLILLSQNAIPGDLFYPVKRGMENMVLAAASVSPSTRVAFRTDLTERRFSEAQQLLVNKADTTAYTEFVSEVSTTQQDLASFGNQQQKIELTDKLIAKIDTYQNQLTQQQNQVQIAQQTVPQNITAQPTSVSTPVQFTPAPAPTSSPIQINQTSAPVQSSQPAESIAPIGQPAAPTEQPVALNTPIPTIQPQAVSTIANNPQKAEEVKATIADTKVELQKIKEKLQREKEDAQFKEKVKEEIQKQKEGQNKKGENGNNN